MSNMFDFLNWMQSESEDKRLECVHHLLHILQTGSDLRQLVLTASDGKSGHKSCCVLQPLATVGKITTQGF